MSIGVVVGNLGTPRSPTPQDVKTYLRQFLMDPFVIDKPYWFRWVLVNGIIAPLRSHKSAEAYQSVWTPQGSPLLTLTERFTHLLRQEYGSRYQFEVGMRYGEPTIESALEKLKNCEKIILFPQYPQYAESSYRTWMEDALLAAQKLGLTNKLFSVNAFYDDTHYLEALAVQMKEKLQGVDYDHLLLSYHGLPERHMKKVDPETNQCLQKANCCDSIRAENRRCYRAQCYSVSRQITQRLSIKSYSVSFQSRLGRDPWIQPFTDVVIQDLPKKGIKKLAVAMPAFTVDCLETLEEIHMRAKEDFLSAGGEQFTAIPCLNDHPAWVRAVGPILENSLASAVKPCP